LCILVWALPLHLRAALALLVLALALLLRALALLFLALPLLLRIALALLFLALALHLRALALLLRLLLRCLLPPQPLLALVRLIGQDSPRCDEKKYGAQCNPEHGAFKHLFHEPSPR
jgi:hypothetical protein